MQLRDMDFLVLLLITGHAVYLLHLQDTQS